ncbi:hypothetical protein CMV_016250 [Castanea mollissima]|uniref:Uncharacterized protein n=1 Tax=Castanea mollissima TaxID=60419 RepID=A0A8J4QUQ7_9ROSI|nr:hypothetical protein CMV_016250 [Castanea mollissima]
MTSIGSRHLLIGGFDGKSNFGNLWWLVPEEDPIAKQFTAPPPKDIPENKDVTIANNNVQSALETVEALRDHWRKAIPSDRANDGSDLDSADAGLLGKDAYRFYHIKNASQECR